MIGKQPEHVVSAPVAQFELAEELIEATRHSLSFISTELAENLEADLVKELPEFDPEIFSIDRFFSMSRF